MPENRDFEDDETFETEDEESYATEDPESVAGRVDEEDDTLYDEDEDDDLDENALDDERATDEVGSEGGSPGSTVANRRSQVGRSHGSEATQTWKPLDNEPVDTTDDIGAPKRRVP